MLHVSVGCWGYRLAYPILRKPIVLSTGSVWDGNNVAVTGGPVAADGYAWYYITNTFNGNSGWAAGDYLVAGNGGVCG